MPEIIAKTISSGLILIVLLLWVVVLWREIRRGWRRKGGDWRRKGEKCIITQGAVNDVEKVYRDGVLIDPKSYAVEYDEKGRAIINLKEKRGRRKG